MSTKHTPGPWVTDEFSDTSDIARHIMNGNGNGPTYIARLPLVNNYGVVSDAYKCQEANARLIAASPDLLAALHNAAEFLHFYFACDCAESNRLAEGRKSIDHEAKVALSTAISAIAKAEGCEP